VMQRLLLAAVALAVPLSHGLALEQLRGASPLRRPCLPRHSPAVAEAVPAETELLSLLSSGPPASVLGAFAQLEQTSPSPLDLLDDPQASALLDGRWALLATIAAQPGESLEESAASGLQGVVNASGIKVDASPENRPIQQVDLARGRIANEVRARPFGLWELYVRVGGAFRRAAPPASGRRAQVLFDQLEVFTLDGRRLASAGWLFTAQRLFAPSLANGEDTSSWLETTYLSPRVRLGRGNKGSIFVLQRVDDGGGALGEWPI